MKGSCRVGVVNRLKERKHPVESATEIFIDSFVCSVLNLSMFPISISLRHEQRAFGSLGHGEHLY